MKNTHKFEIRDQMGHGGVKAIVTVETDGMLANAEENVGFMDTSSGKLILLLQLGDGFDRDEVKA
jgi:hypothetical protein